MVMAVGLAVALCGSVVHAGFVYSGQLSSRGTDPGLITAGGTWPAGEVTLDWRVAMIASDAWNYTYTLKVPGVDVL
jgi:hypothetical protein